MTDVYNQIFFSSLSPFPTAMNTNHKLEEQYKEKLTVHAQLLPVYAIAIRIWSPRCSDDIPATRATTPADLS